MAGQIYFRKRFRSFVIKGILIAMFFTTTVVINQFGAANKKDSQRINTAKSKESLNNLRRKLLSSEGFTAVYVYNDKYARQNKDPPEVKLEGQHEQPGDMVTNGYNNTEEFVCTEPAYHEFPPDAFTTRERLRGAIAIHLLVVIYMFIALALVCDLYFVASLEKICNKLNLSEDVAGATFMAAGSSAPELFTSVIGVFIAKGDVGVGTIVGSAVFNILFVIGICGILVNQAVQLTWWPLARDSFFYSVSVGILIASIADSHVTWYESLLMLLLYVLYIVIMKFNTRLQTWAVTKAKSFSESNDVRSAILQTGAPVKYYTDYAKFQNESTKQNGQPVELHDSSVIAIDEYLAHCPTKLSFEDACFRFMKGPRFHPITRFKAAAYIIMCERKKYLNDPVFRSNYMKHAPVHCDPVCRVGEEEIPETADTWKKLPSLEADGLFYAVKWIVLLPLSITLYYTIPDCRQPRWDKWFMVTFFMAIFWIAAFSYVMVWMVAVIGFSLGIPDSIMGITFLAAGTSVPDAMASVMVARQGQGDMAISNTMGSNVFDICIGLALPWFIQTAMVSSGATVHINSNGIVFSVILLFLTVVIAIVTIHLLRWRLNKKVGAICLISYSIFLIFSVLIEFNVFGYVNPPMCPEK